MSISEDFTATFCSSEDGKMLSNNTVKVWKTGIIGGYEDSLASIFLRLVILSVTTWNLEGLIQHLIEKAGILQNDINRTCDH